jgi:hypothetical protein
LIEAQFVIITAFIILARGKSVKGTVAEGGFSLQTDRPGFAY